MATHIPHDFVGRSDRDCEDCGLPDRNPVHSIHLYVTRAELRTLINGLEFHDRYRTAVDAYFDNLIPFDAPTNKALDEKLVRIADNLHR